MGGHAYEGPARSHSRAYAPPQRREQEVSPQEQAQQRRRSAEAVLANLAQTERAGAGAVAELERAKTAVDIAGFHEAKTRAERAVTRLKDLARQLDKLELSEDELRELAGEDAGKASARRRGADLAARVAAIEPPMPWERKLAIEAALIGAMPAALPAGSSAKAAFDGAEQRVAVLMGSMSAADRKTFAMREREAEALGARGDELMGRWLRLSAARRRRLLAVRPRPVAITAPLMEGSAESDPVPAEVTATEYIALHRDQIIAAIAPLIGRGSYRSPAPSLVIASAAFAAALVRQLERDGLAAVRAALAEPLEALVDRHRNLSVEAAPVNPMSYALAAGPGFAVGGAEPRSSAPMVGTRDWVPSIAPALVAAIDRQVYESLTRAAPRAAAAQRRADHVIPGHPFDRVVARALCADGASRYAEGARAPGMPASTELRAIEIAWSDDPRLYNWFEVTEPRDASAEEVANQIFGDPARAHELTAAPPLFGVPAAEMQAVKPERIALAGLAVIAGVASWDRDAITAALTPDAQLEIAAGSPAGEEAALATARPGNPAEAAVLGATVEAGFALFAETAASMDVDAGRIAPARARAARRVERLAVLPDAERARFAGLFAAQVAVLDTAGSVLAALRPGAGSLEPASRSSAETLVGIVASSDLAAVARGRLAALGAELQRGRHQPERVALSAARAQLEHASERVTEASEADVEGTWLDLTELGERHASLSEELSELERAEIAGERELEARARGLAVRVESLAAEVRAVSAVYELEAAREIVGAESGARAFLVGKEAELLGQAGGLEWLVDEIADVHARWKTHTARGEPDHKWLHDELSRLGTTAARQALSQAYAAVESTRQRKAILEIAEMIGVGLLSAGAGAALAGAARGVGLGARMATAAEIIGEAGFAAGYSAATSEADFGASFLTELAVGTSMRTAMKTFEQSWNVTATLARSHSALRRAAAVAIDFSAQQVVAQAVGLAVQEIQTVAAEGRTMSTAEVRDALVQGMAIAFGSQIAHRFAAPMLHRIEDLGAAGASALRPRAIEIRERSRALTRSKNPDEAVALMNDLAALLDAEVRMREAAAAADTERGAQVHGKLAGGARDAAMDSTALYLSKARAARDELVSTQASVALVETGFDEHQGVYLGDPAEIDVLMIRLEKLGAELSVRAAPSAPGTPPALEMVATIGERVIRVRERPVRGRPGQDPMSRASDRDPRIARERAAAAARVFELKKEALESWAAAQKEFDLDTTVVGFSAGGVIYIGTRQLHGSVAAIADGPGPMETRGDQAIGQRGDEFEAPGFRPDRLADDGGRATSNDIAGALAAGRSDIGVPMLEGRVIGAERRGDQSDWARADRPLRLRVVSEFGERWAYTSNLVLATGLGDPSFKPIEDVAGERVIAELRAEGLVLGGTDPDLADALSTGRVLVVGGATALWASELAADKGAAVEQIAGAPRGDRKKRAEFDALTAELAVTRDPRRVAEIEQRRLELALPAKKLPRNSEEGGPGNRADVTLRTGEITGIERVGDRVKVQIDGGPWEIYDQVVTAFPSNPRPTLKAVLGDGAASRDGEVPDDSIALRLVEYPPDAGEAVPFALVASTADGATVQLAGAAMSPGAAPWVQRSDRQRFLELLAASAAPDQVGPDSAGVSVGYEAANRRTARGNEAEHMLRYALPGPGATLHLKDVPGAWRSRVERFVIEELKLDPDRAVIEERGGGKTDDRVFEIQVGDKLYAIFKVFRQQKGAEVEQDVLAGLGALEFETLAPVKPRGTMAVDQGTADPGGALLMQKAEGSTFKERLEGIKAMEAGDREEAVTELTADFKRAAVALAELHAATAGGGMMTRTQKEADVLYVVDKLDLHVDAGRMTAEEAKRLDDAIRNRIAGPFYAAAIPATAYHGDAHVGNLSDGLAGGVGREEARIGMFDVGSMKHSVVLDGAGDIPKDAGGTPQLDGISTGANDVGRLLESVESMTGGALTSDQIETLHKVVRATYLKAYRKKSGMTIDKDHLAAAMKLYRIEAELAALENGDAAARDRIWNVVNEPPPSAEGEHLE